MIEVVVGSNVSQATAGIEKFKNSLNTLPAAMKPLSGGIQILNNQIERLHKIAGQGGLSFKQFERVNGLIASTRAEMSKLNAAAAGVAPGFNKLGVASNSANLALINTGRVFQDLPFGILGVANNLNPLLESFQRLKAESGSSRTALKSLGQSLLGGGGLGFALSIASSAAIVFGDRIFGAGKAAKEAKSLADELKESVKGIFSSVAKEATEVGTLVAVLKSETETRERKLSAIKELQKIQPDIFNGLKLEGDAVIGLDAAYKTYLGSLQAVISAKIIQARIEQKITELLKLQGVGATQVEKGLLKANENIRNARIKLAQENPGGSGMLKDLRKTEVEAAKATKEIEDLFKDLQLVSAGIKLDPLKPPKSTEIDKFIDETIRKARQFASEFGEAFVVPDLSDSFLKTKDQIFKASKQLLEDVKNLNLKVRVPVDIDFDFVPAEIGPPLARLGKDLEEAMRGITGIQLEPFVFDPSIIIAIQDEKAKEEVKKIMEDFSKSINQSIKEARENIATEGLATIGESIGAALSGGDLKGVFSNFANIISEGLQAIGKQIIKIGVVALLAKEALKKLFANPALAIAAGIALVAAGAALKGALSGGIKQRAKGGPVNPNEPFLVGEKGPELFYPRSYGTIIPNNSLNNSVAASLGNRPQVQTVMVIGEIQGDVIRLTQARSQKRAGRSYG